MVSPTFWVALGLFILLLLAWYYGRDTIARAMVARIRLIESRVNEVRGVLESARTLHEETKQRHVELERELRLIEKHAVDEANTLCEERSRAFEDRMLHKEKQMDVRMAMERQQMAEDLRGALLLLALRGVEDGLSGSRSSGLDEKSQKEKALSNFSRVLAGE